MLEIFMPNFDRSGQQRDYFYKRGYFCSEEVLISTTITNNNSKRAKAVPLI